MSDRGMLEDLITGAMNEVQKKVKELAQGEMSQLTGGLKIPGLFT
jgi:DNA-binding protein YbaB